MLGRTALTEWEDSNATDIGCCMQYVGRDRKKQLPDKGSCQWNVYYSLPSFLRCTSRQEMAAGVTPEILDA